MGLLLSARHTGASSPTAVAKIKLRSPQTRKRLRNPSRRMANKNRRRTSFSLRGWKRRVKPGSGEGCATLKLCSLPARLPIILKFATQVAAPEGNDGIGPAHGPEHAVPMVVSPETSICVEWVDFG